MFKILFVRRHCMAKFVIDNYFEKINTNNKQEKTHIEVLSEFLKTKVFNGDDFDVEVFALLNENDLLESLIYYIERNKITSKQTAKAYLGNVKNLFSNLEGFYQISNSVYVNGNFLPNFELEAGKIIANLNATIDKEIATDDEYEETLKSINELSAQYSFDAAKKGIDKYIDIDNQNSLSDGPDMFRRIRSICATMLVLEYGLKNETIRDMKTSELDLSSNIIKRGKYELQLSADLKNSFNEYLRIRDYLLKRLEITQEFLFVGRDGSSFVGTRDYANKLFSILAQQKGGSVATAIFAQKCLIRMINQGLNSALIEEITGYKDRTYKKLCNLINQDEEYIQAKLNSFMGLSNQRQPKTLKKGYINCPLCGKEVRATREELILIKYPGDKTLYLACNKCGEKEKAKIGANAGE